MYIQLQFRYNYLGCAFSYNSILYDTLEMLYLVRIKYKIELDIPFDGGSTLNENAMHFHALKTESCHDANFIVAGANFIVAGATTGPCYDNLLYHQWWRSWHKKNVATSTILTQCLLLFQSSLTHLPLDKMTAILQTMFLDAFLWIKNFIFSLKKNLFLRVYLVDNNPALV